MSDLIEKIKHTPFPVLVQKAFRLLKFHVDKVSERMKARLKLMEATEADLYRFFGSRDVTTIIENLNSQSDRMFAWIPSDIDAIDTEKLLTHTFNLLGSGEVTLSDTIDWHTDFKSGYRWSSDTYYKDTTKKIPPAPGVDIKVPWELSRLQHLVAMGKAFRQTKDPRLAKEFRNQVLDWIRKNPVCFGVNWACTMDVAIRAANMILGYHFMKDAPELDIGFKKEFLKSLVTHGRFIKNNLEWTEVCRSNHYLSDIAGLAMIGVLFSSTDEGKSWAEFCFQELETEMKVQVFPDGVDHEVSTSYHRLVTELFSWGTKILTEGVGFTFSDEYLEKLQAMYGFIRAYTRPDGTTPLIGDMDDGRFVILTDYFTWHRSDHRHLFNEFPEYVGEPGKNQDSAGFPEGGFYFMRSGDNHMAIRCGTVGLDGFGCHSHCDQLSFDLSVGGKPVIVDPGAYIYTPYPEWRRTFHDTGYHNTVRINNEEQNRPRGEYLFSFFDDTKARCLSWSTSEREDLFSGEHYGYTRLAGSFVHRRNIRFDKVGFLWEISDEVKGDGEALLEWFFLVHPDCTVHQGPEKSVEIRTADFSLTLSPASFTGELFIEDSFYSPSYGIKVPSKRIRYKAQVNVPVIVKWHINNREWWESLQK